ncbi:unnamed protein product [Clonostachys rosea]|uniref:Beta-xylosidase C-terminal Concanavalin A-like domain-containing protein n=1 Tax=Bionectria ochroleuca TaxID=29856 RepID=A0ABY6V0W0_BIOOC|nr:unnamed protein product [Clonostachys rosea]
MRSLLYFASAVAAMSVARQVNQDAVSVVNLANNTGESKHGASGVLYGLPLEIDQIPDKWFIDMDYGFSRGGGSAQTAGGHAWITSFEEYKIRMNAVVANYRIVRKYDGRYTAMLSDLWGADGGQHQTDGPYPGDNGNWTMWDEFLAQVVKDLHENDAVEGMTLDIWNEPNGEVYWDRPQEQYHEAWARAYAYLRQELPNTWLSGPAVNVDPSVDSEWWTKYASFVSQNGTVPDEWAWHVLANPDFATSRDRLWELLDKYSLPHNPININEYALDVEQTPVYSAWYIANFERINAMGARSCWIPAFQAYDMLSGLLTKPNAGNPELYDPKDQNYQATGQYLVYQYYGSGMTGHRVETQISGNKDFDVYATVDGNNLKMLYGSRRQTGESAILVNGLDAIGLPATGNLKIKVLAFPFPGGLETGRFNAVDKPEDIGTFDVSYNDNFVQFPVWPADQFTAYAFEISGSS